MDDVGWTVSIVLIAVVLLVLAAIVHRSLSISRDRERVRAFADAYTRASLGEPEDGYTAFTPEHLTNHLLWVACQSESAADCSANECLINALSRNQSAVELVCAHVHRACPQRCLIMPTCQTIGLRACFDEPDDDYSYAQYII